MNNKRKGIIILAALLLFALLVTAGVVLAVLITNTQRRVNEFTFGNASIDLTEDAWDSLASEDRVVYPGRSISKDPTVTNTGETDLYIFVEVQVPCAEVQTVSSTETLVEAKCQELFTYETDDNWQLVQSELNADSTAMVRLYAYNAALLPNETTTALFSKVTFLNILEGELEMNTTLTMPVNAYAIQVGCLNEQGETFEARMLDAYSKYLAQISKQ